MHYQHRVFETQAGVSRLTINRPGVMNALNRAAVQEMSHALDWIRDEGQSRVLVITGAGRAEQWGLIYKAVPPEDLARASDELTERLAKGPTQAYGLIRQGLRRSMEGSLTETLRLERRNRRLASRTDDFAEGVAAFQSKRPPEFRGK